MLRQWTIISSAPWRQQNHQGSLRERLSQQQFPWAEEWRAEEGRRSSHTAILVPTRNCWIDGEDIHDIYHTEKQAKLNIKRGSQIPKSCIDSPLWPSSSRIGLRLFYQQVCYNNTPPSLYRTKTFEASLPASSQFEQRTCRTLMNIITA